MLTPKTNLQAYWQREVSQEMNGITFCVCSISWVSRCFLAAIPRNFLSLSQDRERAVYGAMSKRGCSKKSISTRDEWDHLLRLLNIMNLSMCSCSHVLSNRKQSIMSKRAQESASKKFSVVTKKQTDVFGVKEPPERKANLSVRFGSFEKPEESRVWSKFCFLDRQETGARQRPRPDSTFSKVATRWRSVLVHQDTCA